ncbi:hypothetical protein CGCSCA4_v003765 [Colletotrichum siamense]|uniref:Zn(2)-C6 fungal-type domain-containing protein n=1 Tax=Colletotrichum siamense TaxID=690259 RepID=A0A9P5K6S2_COLSI|nr:hypothetical protein CGCSCA4_v003765 [Colletotrichum siamense]KAF4862480.1 hypothetical protein CGCSCA2_v003511 [Colletotrichum siamense]
MSTSALASNACHSCSVRKKGCDRSLPACGRCVGRNSVCHYGSSSKAQQPPSNDLDPKEQPLGLASYLGPSVAKRQDPDDLLTSHLFATLKKLNLAVEGVLDAINIAQDLLRVEKTADILELDRMPLPAVVLYKRVGFTAILLGKHHGRDTRDLLREVVQSLSDKIGRRWNVAIHIASQLREASPQSQDTVIA